MYGTLFAISVAKRFVMNIPILMRNIGIALIVRIAIDFYYVAGGFFTK